MTFDSVISCFCFFLIVLFIYFLQLNHLLECTWVCFEYVDCNIHAPWGIAILFLDKNENSSFICI